MSVRVMSVTIHVRNTMSTLTDNAGAGIAIVLWGIPLRTFGVTAGMALRALQADPTEGMGGKVASGAA